MGPYRFSGMMVEFLCYSRVGLVRSKVSLYFRMVLTYTYIFYTLFYNAEQRTLNPYVPLLENSEILACHFEYMLSA